MEIVIIIGILFLGRLFLIKKSRCPYCNKKVLVNKFGEDKCDHCGNKFIYDGGSVKKIKDVNRVVKKDGKLLVVCPYCKDGVTIGSEFGKTYNCPTCNGIFIVKSKTYEEEEKVSSNIQNNNAPIKNTGECESPAKLLESAVTVIGDELSKLKEEKSLDRDALSVRNEDPDRYHDDKDKKIRELENEILNLRNSNTQSYRSNTKQEDSYEYTDAQAGIRSPNSSSFHLDQLDKQHNSSQQQNNQNSIFEKEAVIKMDKDIINMVVQFTETAAGPLTSNQLQYKSELRNILNKKVEREGTIKAYALALEANIIFYYNTWNATQAILENWMKTHNIPSSTQYKAEVTKMKEKLMVTHIGTIKYRNGQSLSNEDKRSLDKYNSITPLNAQIETLEWDYMYFFTRGELIKNLLETIVDNQEYASKFFLANPKEITDMLLKYITIQVNLCLGNIKFNH